MLGFLQYRKSKEVLLLLSIAAMVTCMWGGCQSSDEVTRINGSPESFPNFLARYEKTFNPADYDSTLTIVENGNRNSIGWGTESNVAVTLVIDTLQGYRVQLIFTQDIDQANELRDSLSVQIPDEWIYIVYDAPYYKVRAGNFTDRPAANQLMNRLVRLGYKQAWVVPDKVLNNIPPRPPEITVEPENRIDRQQ